jgi:PLP dependent protein
VTDVAEYSLEPLRARIEEVRTRVAHACQRAGRHPGEVTLIGVTKTFPSELVCAAAQVGLHDFGENRVQELIEKADAIPGVQQGGSVRWHMIGHLQRNKAREVVRVAEAFHALDSLRLAEELDRRSQAAGRVLPCMVQVNISGEGTKSGVDPGDLSAFLRSVEAFEGLRITGLMAIATPVDDPEEVRKEFRQMRRLRDAHPSLNDLSMGMSGDFEVAIEEGATHIRVGSVLFGPRDQ